MSWRLTKLVLDHFAEGGSKKLVLIALADHADDSGDKCYPSIATIARMACCSTSQARRLTHELITAGYVSVVGHELGGAGSRRYQIHTERLAPSTDARGTPGADARGNESRPLAPMRATPSIAMRVTPSIALQAERSITIKNRSSACKRNAVDRDGTDAGFEAFWLAYPRKVAKSSALQAWRLIAPDAELLAYILTAIKQQSQSRQWTRDGGQYVPHPSTWLRGRRWEDATEITQPARSRVVV